jgi:hypothetical protein
MRLSLGVCARDECLSPRGRHQVAGHEQERFIGCGAMLTAGDAEEAGPGCRELEAIAADHRSSML